LTKPVAVNTGLALPRSLWFQPAFEKTCAATKKRKKLFFYLKRVQNVKTYVYSFKNHLITPVVNTHYTITESHW